MAHALANLIEIEEDRDLTKHEFYLPLCGVLQNLVKQDIEAQEALTCSEIAYSLAHDVLNFAVLAGRILWCEGVTANMNRSPDLVAIAVDTENYFVLLRQPTISLLRQLFFSESSRAIAEKYRAILLID